MERSPGERAKTRRSYLKIEVPTHHAQQRKAIQRDNTQTRGTPGPPRRMPSLGLYKAIYDSLCRPRG